MTEEVKEKVLSVYKEFTEKTRALIEATEEYYGKDLVDNDLITFDSFIELLDSRTLGQWGIKKFKDKNDDGEYSISPQEYVKHKGVPLLSWIPDLGILDYLKQQFMCYINTYTYIIIRFPKVKITNEYNKSTIIKELYVRIHLNTFKGNFIEPFNMCRTEFREKEILSGYSHSHLHTISCNNPQSFNFSPPCLGRGPLNNTIQYLKYHYDLDIYGLFLFELSNYVKTESVKGVPYIKLENIGVYTGNKVHINYAYSASLMDDIYPFVKYLVSKKVLKFAFKKDHWCFSDNAYNLWIKVSNVFIEWLNNSYKDSEYMATKLNSLKRMVLNKYVVRNNEVYWPSRNGYENLDTSNVEGITILTFKGKEKNLVVTNKRERSTSESNVLLLSAGTYVNVLSTIIKIVNLLYGKQQPENTTGKESKCLYN